MKLLNSNSYISDLSTLIDIFTYNIKRFDRKFVATPVSSYSYGLNYYKFYWYYPSKLISSVSGEVLFESENFIPHHIETTVWQRGVEKQNNILFCSQLKRNDVNEIINNFISALEITSKNEGVL
jgi:hypothetical protein